MELPEIVKSHIENTDLNDDVDIHNENLNEDEIIVFADDNTPSTSHCTMG